MSRCPEIEEKLAPLFRARGYFSWRVHDSGSGTWFTDFGYTHIEYALYVWLDFDSLALRLVLEVPNTPASIEAVPQQLVDLLDARLAQECAKALG